MSARLAPARAWLDRTLFPSVPTPRLAKRPWEGAALVVCLLAVTVILQLLRVGLPASLDSLWAEDGPIFLQAALFEGFWDALWSPYAGYLVLVPRLIGEGANLVPLQDAAAVVSILSALVAAVSGLAVWYAAAGHIRSPWLRATLACLTALVPVAGLESLDSAAYAPWYMLFATFWLLLWRPASTRGAVLGGLFVLATGLSTPGVWFFLPIVVLRALAARDRRDGLILGAYGLGALAQIPVLAANQAENIDPLWTNEIWGAYVQRVIDGAALGEHAGGVAWSHFGWAFLTLLTIAAIALLAVGIWRSDAGGRLFAAIAVPTSVGLFVISAYQRAVGSQMVWPVDTFHGAGSRYTIVPALILVSLGLVLLESSFRRGGRGGPPSWLTGLVVVGLGLGIVTSFSQDDVATRGTPPWEEALREAASECEVEGVADVTVPISPPPFGLQVPCERIESLAAVRAGALAQAGAGVASSGSGSGSAGGTRSAAKTNPASESAAIAAATGE